MKRIILFFIIFIATSALFVSCKKEKIIPESQKINKEIEEEAEFCEFRIEFIPLEVVFMTPNSANLILQK